MGFYDTTERPRAHGRRLKSAPPRLDFVESGYRFNNPALGRWCSRDPIDENGGVHLYGYLENDGVNQSDFLGLTGACKCGPDVTFWFWGEVHEHLEYARNIKPNYFKFADQAAYDMAYKWMDFSMEGCGGEKCRHTVELAGKCIRKNQLGNIMFTLVGSLQVYLSDSYLASRGYNKINDGRYPKNHPYAGNFGKRTGRLRLDNLTAFGVGKAIADKWKNIDTYKQFHDVVSGAFNDSAVVNTFYDKYGDDPDATLSKLIPENLTVIPEYGGFNTASCTSCGKKWSGSMSSFEARKAMDSAYEQYIKKSGGSGVDKDQWRRLRFENYATDYGYGY